MSKRYLATMSSGFLLLVSSLFTSTASAAESGIPATFYTTCRDAQIMASKGQSDAVSELIAQFGNATVEARALSLPKSDEIDTLVVKQLTIECKKDPDGLLISAVDTALRNLAASTAQH